MKNKKVTLQAKRCFSEDFKRRYEWEKSTISSGAAFTALRSEPSTAESNTTNTAKNDGTANATFTTDRELSVFIARPTELKLSHVRH